MPLSRINAQSLTDASIVSAEIADGAITTAKLADNAVTTAKVNPTQTDITSVGTLTSFRSTGIDDNADATAMTINSSENILIGKTSADNTTVGVRIQPDGFASFARDGNFPLLLNRKSNNGTILDVRKDGTTIGHIGVHDDDGFFFTRGATQQGIVLKNSSLMPCQTDGSNSDADQDLGISSVRWKDLYLSGGAFIGGTGSANKLDDYEEGSFTPTWNSYTPAGSSGKFVKVGSQVTVYAKLVTGTSNSSASVGITNLPFTISGDLGAGAIYHNVVDLFAKSQVTVFTANSTACFLRTEQSGADVGVKYVGTEPDIGGSGTLIWVLMYQTI